MRDCAACQVDPLAQNSELTHSGPIVGAFLVLCFDSLGRGGGNNDEAYTITFEILWKHGDD